MTHGLPTGITTLYDKDGNPVDVEIYDGKARLVVTDNETHNELSEIRLLLTQILDALRGKDHE